MLQVKTSTREINVLNHALEQGHWSTDDSLTDALSEFVKKHEIANDRLFTVIPRYDVTSRILTLPSEDADEIAGMAELAAHDFVPYPPEEIRVAHSILGKNDEGESRVLVVVAHHDIIDHHVQILHSLGLNPEKVLLSTACLANAAAAIATDEDDRVAYANLTPGGLEVIVLQGRSLLYGRGVATETSWELNDESKDQVLAELASEVLTSLAAQRRDSEDGRGASELFLASNVADSIELAEALDQEIDTLCAPVTVDALVTGTHSLKHIPFVALGAVMTAQGRGTCQIDLTQKGELARRASSGLRAKGLRIAAALAILVSAISILYVQAVNQRTAYLNELETRADELRPAVREAVFKRRHFERVQNEVVRHQSALELLAVFCEIAPTAGINIGGFNYKNDDSITVFGRAKALSLVDQLAEDLRKSGRSNVPQFAQASILYRNRGEERRKEIFNFSISIPFPKEEEEEDDA